MLKFCNLAGKNIIVTGASSGLGRATCIILSRLNATVCLIARDKYRLEETESQMVGNSHIVVPFDLCDFTGYKDLFEHIVQHIGKLNGLVHFAGARKTLPLRVMRVDSFKKIIEINLYAFMELAKFFSKKSVIRSYGGSIVVASSVAALRGIPALTGYGASKAAVDGAVRSLACELAPRKIRVNSIAPGHVETEMNLKVKETLSKEAYEQIVKSHPLGIGQPFDVANLVAFLLSDEAKWITGTTIPVDGGFSVK